MPTPSPLLPSDIGKMHVPIPFSNDAVELTISVGLCRAEPLLLGHLLQWALFGALSVQVFIYYLAFPNDHIQRKLIVYGVYAIEVVQAILLARMAYLEFAVGFGNYLALDTIPTTFWFGIPVLISIVTAVVQIFYAYRINILTNSHVIPSVIVFLALLQLGGGITLGIFAKETRLFSRFMDKKTLIVAGIWNGGSALCDVIIAGYMTYLLSRQKSTWKQIQRTIRKLICLILETGMLTAAFAIMNLGFFLICRVTYFQTTSMILGKMYSNTMMVVLNSRMVYGIANDTLSTELTSACQKPTVSFFTSQDGISVTHEQWTDPLDHSVGILTMGGEELKESTESVRVAYFPTL